MGITVEGNLIVKGDQIFDGGIKVVRISGEEKAAEPLTIEMLKEKVDLILNRIENGRLWFPVCKYMMWEGLVGEDDFKAAVEMLQGIYPDVAFNVKDLSSLNCMSFRKSLDEWDRNDAPVSNAFMKYKNIAEALYHL